MKPDVTDIRQYLIDHPNARPLRVTTAQLRQLLLIHEGRVITRGKVRSILSRPVAVGVYEVYLAGGIV